MATVVEELVAKLRLKPDAASWAAGDKLITGMKAAIAGFITVKTIQTFAGWVKDTTAVGDNAVKAAAKLGVTAEAYQELAHAAGLSGVSQEGLQAALGKLANNLDDVAVKGNKASASLALKRIGIQAKELEGHSLDENLAAIAERFSVMPDGVKKSSIAMDLFGKQGRELIPLLNEGRGGIEALRKEAQDLGIVIDGDSAKAMEKFNDDQERLQKTIGGVRNQIVAELLPTFQKVVDKLRGWIAQNRELIREKIHAAVQAVTKAARFLWGVFSDISDWVSDNQETLVGIFETVASVIKVLWKVTAALVKVFFNIGLVAWRAMMLVARAFGDAWNTIKSVGERIWKFFTEDIPNGIVAAFDATWDAVVKGVKKVASTIRNTPGLKQVLDAAEFVGGAAARAVRAVQGDQTPDIDATQIAPSTSEPARTTSPGAQSVNIQGGAMNININGAQDPLAISRQVREAVADEMNSAFLQAREVLG